MTVQPPPVVWVAYDKPYWLVTCCACGFTDHHDNGLIANEIAESHATYFCEGKPT